MESTTQKSQNHAAFTEKTSHLSLHTFLQNLINQAVIAAPDMQSRHTGHTIPKSTKVASPGGRFPDQIMWSLNIRMVVDRKARAASRKAADSKGRRSKQTDIT